MRIIAGKYRGKNLFLPKDKNTRPLKDLVKENIFNLLTHSKEVKIELSNSYVLDLFAGTGSFGMECLSRGAKEVSFLENHAEAIKILRKNLNSLKNTNNYKIINNEIFNFIKKSKNFNNKFDIIFMDPPYKENRINQLIEHIIDKKLLKEKGFLITHRHKKDTIKLTEKIKVFDERIYGLSKIIFAH
jgi:16S rRNA (guanine966-N2)-methyltransferase